MAEYVHVADAKELNDGGMRMVMVEEQEILIAKVGDKYYATQNRCPHMGGNLSKGKLEGTIVTCPVHGSQFDLVDGKVIRWTNWTGPKLAMGKILKSPRPLKTYEVKVEGDKVSVAGNK